MEEKRPLLMSIKDELGDVIDVKSPDNTTAAEQRQNRLAAEQAKFDPDHYLADLFEDDYIHHLLKYQPWWIEAKNKREKTLQTCLEQHAEEATGKACVLKCLLAIHRIFRENDPAYILNDLYISDYCVWIQKAKSKKVVALAEVLLKTKLRKADLGFELEELEAAALLVQEEENRTAACQVSRQRQSSSESEEETGDSGESSSCSSSGTDESDSEEGDSPGRAKDVQIKQPSILEQKAGPPGATIIPVANPRAEQLDCAAELLADENAAISDSAVKKVQSASSSITRKLIEELGEQVHSVVKISEWSEGAASESCNMLQDEQAKPSVESTEHTVPGPAAAAAAAQQGNFLEVCPKRSPLLIIANCHEDVEDS
ncbi:UNVERIFIED_CONTAM: hypothetical protein FKN15_073779 [Acipenser sinensis]